MRKSIVITNPVDLVAAAVVFCDGERPSAATGRHDHLPSSDGDAEMHG